MDLTYVNLHLHEGNNALTMTTSEISVSESAFLYKATTICKTHVGSVAEEVYSQLITHAIVALIIGKLNKCDHLLERSKGFDALFIIPGFSYSLADLFETSFTKKRLNIMRKREKKMHKNHSFTSYMEINDYWLWAS